jgi:hypothetical protein
VAPNRGRNSTSRAPESGYLLYRGAESGSKQYLASTSTAGHGPDLVAGTPASAITFATTGNADRTLSLTGSCTGGISGEAVAAGGSGAHTNVQPSTVCNVWIKI